MQLTALRGTAERLRSPYAVRALRSATALSLALLLALIVMGSMTARPAHAAKITTGTVTGTVYFNKLETKDLKSAIAAGGVCSGLAAIPPKYVGALAASACGASVGALTIQAIRADNRGMCAKIKFTLPRVPPAWWPDIYGGDYCT